MNSAENTRVFWGPLSPLASFSGGGLLIMASSRLSWALVCAGALLWVYVLSVLAARPLLGLKGRMFPGQGGTLVFLFLSSFTGSLYLLFLWFTSPLAALELFFPLCLVSLFCAGGGLFRRIETLDIGGAVSLAAREAAVLGALLAVFALVREPLGFASLTLPGGSRAAVLLFSFDGKGFFPARIIATSAGALFLLGYAAALYRYCKSIYAPREGEL
jgi:hypothetical protein